MKIEFELDEKSFIEDVKKYAIRRFKERLEHDCTTAFRDAEAPLDWYDHYEYSKFDRHPVTKTDIGSIIYAWVNTEFRDTVYKYISHQVDIKKMVESITVSDDLLNNMCDRIMSSKTFADRMANRLAKLEQEK